MDSQVRSLYKALMRADKLEMLLSVEPLLEVGTLLGVEYTFDGIGVERIEVTVRGGTVG